MPRPSIALAIVLMASASAAGETAGQEPLDFEGYRETVEPIFLAERGGWGTRARALRHLSRRAGDAAPSPAASGDG